MSVIRLICCILVLTWASTHPTSAQPACTRSSAELAAYLDLLDSADGPKSAGDSLQIRRQVAQTAVLLPDQLLERIAVGARRNESGNLTDERWRVQPDALPVLAAWWRSQDPIPATTKNERLEEHLCRVEYADRQFSSRSSPTGWDDRGAVYVRLGDPKTEHSIEFSDPALLRILVKTSAPIVRSDFPENEIWFYEEIDRSGYFLFVRRGDNYRLGRFEDLLPGSLAIVSGRQTHLFTQGEPAPDKTDVLLATLRAILRELSIYHPDFGPPYMEVSAYLESLETGRGSGVPMLTPSEETLLPHLFATRQLAEVQTIEDSDHRIRAERLPLQRSLVDRWIDPLAVTVRTARFLDNDGSTRTEVYWTAPAADGTVGGSLSQFVFNVTGIRQKGDFTPAGVFTSRFQVRAIPFGEDARLPVQRLAIPGSNDTYHIALQWDEYRLVTSEGRLRKSSADPVRRGVVRMDSLRTLSPDEGLLELSDLLPVSLAEPWTARERPPATALLEVAKSTDGPIGLYFEVYHLTYGPDDRTRFSVDISIAGLRMDRNGMLTETGATTRMSSMFIEESRSAGELVEMDLSESQQAADNLRICVAVSDLVSEQGVERCTTLYTVR